MRPTRSTRCGGRRRTTCSVASDRGLRRFRSSSRRPTGSPPASDLYDRRVPRSLAFVGWHCSGMLRTRCCRAPDRAPARRWRTARRWPRHSWNYRSDPAFASTRSSPPTVIMAGPSPVRCPGRRARPPLPWRCGRAGRARIAGGLAEPPGSACRWRPPQVCSTTSLELVMTGVTLARSPARLPSRIRLLLTATRAHWRRDRGQRPDEATRVRAVDHPGFPSQPVASPASSAERIGKSTTLRALLGLVAPTGWTAKIAGRRYRDLADPLGQVGAMLEATAHPSRSARNHLRAIAADARASRDGSRRYSTCRAVCLGRPARGRLLVGDGRHDLPRSCRCGARGDHRGLGDAGRASLRPTRRHVLSPGVVRGTCPPLTVIR